MGKFVQQNPTPLSFAMNQAKTYQSSPLATQGRQFLQTPLSPTAQRVADVPLSFMKGMTKGAAGFTGAENLIKPLRTDYKPFTTAGKISDVLGGFAGYSVGAGKLLMPLESAVAAKFGTARAGTPLLSKLATKTLPALITKNIASSFVTAPIRSVIEKKPFKQVLAEDVGGSIAGEGIMAGGLLVGTKALGFKNLPQFEGFDKKLKAEISDLVARIQPAKLEKVLNDETRMDIAKDGTFNTYARLGEFFEHASLFKNYPELKHLKVIFEEKPEGFNKEGLGSFNTETFSITIDPQLRLKPAEFRSVFLHEIQHAIQEIEGFAKGSGIDQFLWATVNLTKEKHPDWSEKQILKEAGPEALKWYQRVAGEIEARAVELRSNLTSKQRKSMPFYEGIMEKEKINKKDIIFNEGEGIYSKAQPQTGGGGGVPKIRGKVSSPTENYKDLNQSVDQISKPILEKQLKDVSAIRTKATSEVSSKPIISDKGKLNISRLKVKGAGKEALEAINEEVKPTIIGNKEVVEAAKTATGSKGAMSDDQMKNLLAQQLKNRQKVVDLQARFNKLKAEGASEVELGKVLLDMSNQSKVAIEGGTFAGRLLQAQNILADESATPTQKILALLNNAGVDQEKYLKDAVKVNWDNPNEVVSFYRKYVPPKFGEILDEVRYSNMLSSPLTHIINVSSNAMMTGVVAPVEKTITGALDWGKSKLTGSERQYYTSSGIDYAGGYVKALPQAFKKAMSVLKGEEILTKPDYQRIPLGSKGILKAYTTPLRGLEAMDQFFKTLVESGVTAELKKAPQKLSVSQISENATKEANYRLFRQAFDPNGELGQGEVLKIFDKWNSGIAYLRRLPGGKWVLPFLQTPTNILKQGVEYSPLGWTTAIRAKKPLEQLSKFIIGTGVAIGAYQLAKNGLTSWEAPTSESERDLYYAAGLQPYSVKIGDKWVSFSKMGPLSYPLAMAAALAEAERKNPDQNKINNIGKSISGMLGFFGDQSYVRSIGDLVDAIQGGVNIGPTALTAQAANFAGQLVPYKSFLTWLGRITDPVYRKAKTFEERMVKDLPILGKNLKPYTNLEGQPSVRDFPLLNAVSPFKVTQEKSNEAQMLKTYQTEQVSRAIEKRADEAFLQGGNAPEAKTIYRYINDSGELKKIDTSKATSLPSNTTYEKAIKDKKAFSMVAEILDSNLDADKKAKALQELGISTDDATYYNVARQTNEIKTAWINDAISVLPQNDRGKLINYLVSQRKVVNGDMILADGVITQLTDDGIISKTEATMLKNLKITGGTVKTKLTGRGKKVTIKKITTPKSTKVKAPNIKSMSQLLKKGVKLKVKKYSFRSKL